MRSNISAGALLSLITLATQSTACYTHSRDISDEEFDRQIARHQARQLPSRVDTEIRNVRVFDGFCIGPPTSVFIKGDRIAATGSKADLVIDGEGKFLIPGLIDSHLHISDLSGLANATSFGVTSVMNMACRNYTQCAPLRNVPGMADWLSAGVPATGPGSNHAKNMNLPDSLLFHPGDDPTETLANVVSNGSDWMKITVEVNGPDLASQKALVSQAHSFGIFAVSHAADLESYNEAQLSGVDGIQHTPANRPIDSDLLSRLSTSGQFVTATMEIWRLGFGNPALLAATQGGQPDDRKAVSFDIVRNNVVALRKAGVPVLAGTDAVGAQGPFIIPFGLTLHCELQNLVGAGYTPAAALRAATMLPNQYHRLGDRGSISPGLRADMVLLNSNPLEKISNTRDIARIWVGGIEYKDVAKSALVCDDLLNQAPPKPIRP
ncbi:amidohydrolase [Nemania sp. NC0429]|nr:amidohydrolase [Nemania sp. NC0429]